MRYSVFIFTNKTVNNALDSYKLFINVTIVRTHQHRAGAPKNGADQAIGCSRGGPSTTIHACINALGNPTRLILTPGQMADVTKGAALIEVISTDAVIADRDYDCDQFVKTIQAPSAQAIIP